MQAADYKEFLAHYLAILEQLSLSCQLGASQDEKGCLSIEGKLYRNGNEYSIFKQHEQQYYRRLTYLRLAEHTFNFFLDQFPQELIDTHFQQGRQGYGEFKQRRDQVADRIAQTLENNPEATDRFQRFCENMKAIRTLGCYL